ncbi:hypothetical protein GCM10027418_32390 [Mariniluteicoccus endophyticus]
MHERGMVTAELALGLVALVVALTAAFGLVGVALVQGQCWDTASEVARQVARGDDEAARRARRDAPRGADVDVDRRGNVVVVEVEAPARPFGERGPTVRLRASAQVVTEPGVR